MENVELSSENRDWSPGIGDKAAAWGLHILTATGAIWGLLSIIAISEGAWKAAFGWMAFAILVDSADGLLARRLRVKEVLPTFDGALLDNIVDYITFVLAPAYLLYAYIGPDQVPLVPPEFALLSASLILLASGYQFCQGDAKTDDHYFKGFPSYWNIVVFYMVILDLGVWVNLGIILLLCVLVFVPIKYIYPSRTPRLRGLTLTLGMIWGIVTIALLIQFPTVNQWLVVASMLFIVYYVGLSLYVMYEERGT